MLGAIRCSCLVIPSLGSRRRAELTVRRSWSEAWFDSRGVASRIRDCCEEGCVTGDLGLEPLGEHSEEDKRKLSQLLDYLHLDLLTFSPEADQEDDAFSETIDEEAFSDFIVEGRKMLQISSSTVCYGATADAVADRVWTSVGSLLADDRAQTGLLVAMPNYVGDAVRYVDDEIIAPLESLGFGPDRIEARGYRRAQGAPFPGFRVLYYPAPKN